MRIAPEVGKWVLVESNYRTYVSQIVSVGKREMRLETTTNPNRFTLGGSRVGGGDFDSYIARVINEEELKAARAKIKHIKDAQDGMEIVMQLEARIGKMNPELLELVMVDLNSIKSKLRKYGNQDI
jgi:hypothetical protein